MSPFPRGGGGRVVGTARMARHARPEGAALAANGRRGLERAGATTTGSRRMKQKLPPRERDAEVGKMETGRREPERSRQTALTMHKLPPREGDAGLEGGGAGEQTGRKARPGNAPAK